MKIIIQSTEVVEQLDEWKKSDPKILVKIISLITEISSTPYTGTGKPEY